MAPSLHLHLKTLNSLPNLFSGSKEGTFSVAGSQIAILYYPAPSSLE